MEKGYNQAVSTLNQFDNDYDFMSFLTSTDSSNSEVFVNV